MTTATPTRQRRQADSLTPPQIARRYGIHGDKVLSWIRSGELPAVNVATRPDQRPRWTVTPEGLAAFEAKRRAVPEVKPIRRKRKPTDYREYL